MGEFKKFCEENNITVPTAVIDFHNGNFETIFDCEKGDRSGDYLALAQAHEERRISEETAASRNAQYELFLKAGHINLA